MKPFFSLMALCFSVLVVAGPCFDLAKPLTQPLKKPIPLGANKPRFEKGEKSGGIFWGAARQLIAAPLPIIDSWIRDHRNLKDMSRTKVKTTIQKINSLLEVHHVIVDLQVFGPISVDWVEEWTYAIEKGNFDKPEMIVANYQKISGTSHIRHLCGSIVLKQVDSKTDVYLYEESEASHYSPERILEMHEGNLKNIIRDTNQEGPASG